jgi:hypothetical protein
MTKVWRKVWRAYVTILKAVGRFNTLLLLSLVYFLVLPLARLSLMLRGVGRRRTLSSGWQKRPPAYPHAHEHQF